MSLFDLFKFFDPVRFILFALVLYFLSVLSKRLGEVMGMKKYYYIYYIGIFFILSGSTMLVLSYGYFQNARFIGNVFLSLGLTFGLIASIKYWGWLIKEFFKG